MSRPYTRLPQPDTQDGATLRTRAAALLEWLVNPVPARQTLPKNVIPFPGTRLDPRWNERIGVQIALVILTTLVVNLLLILVFAGIL